MHDVSLTPDMLLDLDLATFLCWCDEIGLTANIDWHFVSAGHSKYHKIGFASSEVAMLFRLRFNV